jgi:hypothetical protein
MGTTEEGAVRLNAVPDDLAAAMLTNRGKLEDGALEAVECMPLSGGDDIKGEIVVVTADLTSSHEDLLGTGIAPRCPPEKVTW